MKRNIILQTMRATFTVALMVATCTSCDSVIYDDLAPCPEEPTPTPIPTPEGSNGVSLRFVYDYNMEYANAFPSKVDCLTLYIYDSAGNYLDTQIETSSVLADEAYRMQLDLDAGDYHFVAYGGMACSNASFKPISEPTSGSELSSLETELQHDGDTSDEDLHGFYFGELDMTVTGNTSNYEEGTVEMMKNTNNVQIFLQQRNGNPVLADDFEFFITDDNTLFDCNNNIIPAGTITYMPWTKGERTTSSQADNDEEDVEVAYAELSTSRLWTGNSPHLIVNRASDGSTIIDIPLNNYLLLVKSDHYSAMGNQEFLDRQDEWELLFFLDEGNEWIRTYIVVNDWVVRINDTSLN